MPYLRKMLQQPALVGRKVIDLLRAEGLTGFSLRLRRWLRSRRRSLVVQHTNGIPRVTSRYQLWTEQHRLSSDELNQQRISVAELKYKPTISLMTPVFNPPPDILRSTIESVRAQTYPFWELCLADGASTRPGVSEILREFEHLDNRIRIKRLDENLGISRNSNEAARLATGEFLMIFDHDDLLEPNALFEIAQAINASPNTDWIYTDEDLITMDGSRRFSPFFKPDWSPELLLSANYLMHSVIRTSLFWEVGGFDNQFDGAQDWDLAFKCTERTSHIVHVPRVLYHWRTIPGSAAASFSAKSYVFERQLRCISNHLVRQGLVGAQARFVSPMYTRVEWPTRGSSVSIIVQSRRPQAKLCQHLHHLKKVTTYPEYEIIATHLSKHYITPAYTRDEQTDVRVYELPDEMGDMQARQWAIEHANGDVLVFLSDELTPLTGDWLEELVRWAERWEIGVVGGKLLSKRKSIERAGLVLGLNGDVGHVFKGARELDTGPFGSVDWYRTYSALSSDCIAIRRDMIDLLGGFSEEVSPTQADLDFCARVSQTGYRNVYTPYSKLMYIRDNAKKNTRSTAVRSNKVHRVNGPTIRDPYFNRNLSLRHCLPTIVLTPPHN